MIWAILICNVNKLKQSTFEIPSREATCCTLLQDRRKARTLPCQHLGNVLHISTQTANMIGTAVYTKSPEYNRFKRRLIPAQHKIPRTTVKRPAGFRLEGKKNGKKPRFHFEGGTGAFQVSMLQLLRLFIAF
jgi:hypothetical protein